MSRWGWAEVAGLPTVTVEVAFASQPGDPTQVWTNISAFVDLPAGLRIEHGRGDEYGDVQPDRLTVTLVNDDGRFTPDLASSPYFPNVKIGRQIRVTLTPPGGTARVRFVGRVASWPVGWVGGPAKMARAAMLATGKLALLGRAPLLPAGQEEILGRAGLAGYWVLDEPAGAVLGSDSSGAGQYPLTRRQIGPGDGKLDFAAGAGPGPDRLAAPVFTPLGPGDGYSLYATLRSPIGTAGSTVLACINPPPAAALANAPVLFLEDRVGSWVGVLVSAGGQYTVVQYDAKTRLTQTGVGSIFVARNTDQTVTVVVDWFVVGVSARATVYYGPLNAASVTWPATTLPVFTAVQAGGAKARGSGTYTGTLSNVAVFDAALTPTDVADINFSLINSGDAFQSWVWWRRLLGFRGEAANYGVTGLAYTDKIGPQPTAGKSLPEALHQVARTVGAVYYTSVTGQNILQCRDFRYNRSVALSVSGAAGHVEVDLDLAGDDTGMANDTTASAENGVGFRYEDGASLAEYGLYPATISGLFRQAVDAQSAAQGRVSAGASPRLRVPNLGFNLLCSPPSLVASLLLLGIGDRVAVTDMPAQSPAAKLDLFVEGWTETLSDREWKMVLNTSPADRSDYWIVGDATRGVVGSTNRVGW